MADAPNNRLRLDRLADEWARAHGAELPHDDTGRPLGGHTQERATHLDPGRERRERLEGYQEWLRVRLSAIKATITSLHAEQRALRVEERVLGLRLGDDRTEREGGSDGLGGRNLAEIALRLCRSRPWVVAVMARIEASIAGRGAGRASPVATLGCRWCTSPILRAGVRGRPRIFCSDACRRSCQNAAAIAAARVCAQADDYAKSIPINRGHAI